MKLSRWMTRTVLMAVLAMVAAVDDVNDRTVVGAVLTRSMPVTATGR